jgi:tagaturonate reductase
MDLLCRAYLENHNVELDFDPGSFDYPERIIQFGTGNLLRGLVDFLIDKANRKGIFKGRVVLVKSTGTDTTEWVRQDCLYTVIEEGILTTADGRKRSVISAVSRVIAAPTGWDQVLQCAADPNIVICISNTTEAGLVYQPENIFSEQGPGTYPAKLTRYLWERFEKLGDGKKSGMVILPTELLVDNGTLLKKMVIEHALAHKLRASFIRWLESANEFCNTLVDRIVPGKSEKDDLIQSGSSLYTDHLHSSAEAYLLWAIQGGPAIAKRLPFHEVDPRVVIRPDISDLREQKLRILNGSNSFVAALAYLYGCNTTYDTMQDGLMHRYVETQISREILPTIADRCPEAPAFAKDVLERFSNPGIRYPLLNIALQYCSKMDSRNTMTFLRFYEKQQQLPLLCMVGMAAFILFYVPAGKENETYFGMREARKYIYRDEKTGVLCSILEGIEFSDADQVTEKISRIFSDPRLFHPDLGKLRGFTTQLAAWMNRLHWNGIQKTLSEILDAYEN